MEEGHQLRDRLNQTGRGRSTAKSTVNKAFNRRAVSANNVPERSGVMVDRPEEELRGLPIMLAYQNFNDHWSAVLTDYQIIYPQYLAANIQLRDHTLTGLIHYIRQLFRNSPPGHYKVQTRLGLALMRWDKEQGVPYLIYHEPIINMRLHDLITIYDNASLQRLLNRYARINLHDHFMRIERELADSSESRLFAVTNAEFIAYKVT